MSSPTHEAVLKATHDMVAKGLVSGTAVGIRCYRGTRDVDTDGQRNAANCH